MLSLAHVRQVLSLQTSLLQMNNCISPCGLYQPLLVFMMSAGALTCNAVLQDPAIHAAGCTLSSV